MSDEQRKGYQQGFEDSLKRFHQLSIGQLAHNQPSARLSSLQPISFEQDPPVQNPAPQRPSTQQKPENSNDSIMKKIFRYCKEFFDILE